ncbi:MAG: threonine/serine dehydratase [Candidatus Acidiferrales bacterium]
MKLKVDAAGLSIKPGLDVIRNAREFLAKHFACTRLVAAAYLSERMGKRVYLKLEMELPTGSFKVRGALWALAVRLKKTGTQEASASNTGNSGEAIEEVIASSTGNHGAAVAYAAKLLGVKARIFLPAGCNPVKRGRIAALGAEIVENGAADLAAAFELATEYAKRPGVYFLNDATDADLPAGPATIGCEILEQLPEVSSIVVPMGDTALIRGIAAAVKQLAPRVKIIGVQAERAPAYYRSWKEDRVVGTEKCDTIADGLATRTPDAGNVRDVKKLVDDVVLVSEEQMLRAIETLLVEEHVLAEPAGAASTAALLHMRADYGENVVLVVSGANISRDVLQRAVGAP